MEFNLNQSQTDIQPSNNTVQNAVTSFKGLQFNALDDSIIQKESVVVMSIGDTIDPIPIEKFVMTTQKKERISIVTSSELGIKYHYCQSIGTFFCFGSSCCENLGRPKIRYLLPIIVYETDSSGIKIVSSTFTLKVLSLAPTSYEKIQTLSKLSGDLSNIDILVTCMDDKYQDMDFHRIDGPATWKIHEEMYKAVESQFRSLQKFVPLIVARKISEETFKAKMSTTPNVASNTGVAPDGRAQTSFSPSDFDTSFRK